jgi:hypothetical protein
MACESTSSLLSLTLSHNYLSGEIPLWLQEKSMVHLDLSHNKLTGDANGFKHQEAFNRSSLMVEWSNQYLNKNLTLSVNRLSGDLPSSLGTKQRMIPNAPPIDIILWSYCSDPQLRNSLFASFFGRFTQPNKFPDKISRSAYAVYHLLCLSFSSFKKG